MSVVAQQVTPGPGRRLLQYLLLGRRALIIWPYALLVLLAVALLVVGLPTMPAPSAGDAVLAGSRPVPVAITPAEMAAVRDLALATDPLPPPPPPPQAWMPQQYKLFGVKNQYRGAFRRATTVLAADAGACAPRAVGEAQQALTAATDRNGQTRGVIAYHQGLINLCSADGAKSALAAFDSALAEIDEYEKSIAFSGLSEADRDQNSAYLAQYRLALNYARGRALTDLELFGEAQSAFDLARDAIVKVHQYSRAGIGTRLSSADRDLFDFSDTAIDAGKVAAGLKAGNSFAEAYAALKAAGGDFTADPAFAANAAVAAAANGDVARVRRIFEAVLGDVETVDGAQRWLAHNREALNRVVAMAVVANVQFSETEALRGGASERASNVRVKFEESRANPTFGQIMLPGNDTAVIDRWLWLNRDKLDLAGRRLDSFRKSELYERLLPADDWGMIRNAREQAMAANSAALLESAAALRRQDPAAADSLLRDLGSGAWPLVTGMQARLALRTGGNEAWIFIWVLGVVVFVMLWAVFAQLRIGQRRTFPRRHFDQRDPNGLNSAAAPIAARVAASEATQHAEPRRSADGR